MKFTCLVSFLFLVGFVVLPFSAQDTSPSESDIVRSALVFSSNRYGSYDLFLMATDGSNVYQLTNEVSDERYPTWSPDGNSILFSANLYGNYDLFEMSLLDNSIHQLTITDANELQARYSSDGLKIVYVSDLDGDNEIFTMPTGGGDSEQLTYNEVADEYPSFSPEGTKILFSSFREGNSKVFLMDADGKYPIKLVDAESTTPAWAPDGQQILYSCHRTRVLNSGTWDICVADANGQNQRRVAENDARDNQPAFSATGSYLVFASTRDGGQDREIVVMDRSGRDVIVLTSDSTEDVDPSWSPQLPEIQVRSITATATRITDILEASEVDLPNCNGTIDKVYKQTYSKTIDRTIQPTEATETHIGAGLSFFFKLIDFNIYDRIRSTINMDENETISVTKEINLGAAPGTWVSYNVQWVTQSTVIEVEYVQGDRVFTEEYIVVESLDVITSDAIPHECP